MARGEDWQCFAVSCGHVIYYLAPAAEIAVTSDSPPGFLLLWALYYAHLAFLFLLSASSATTLKAAVNNAQTRDLV